ncbi:TonB C-terminal domain-containing protein [Marinobacter sp. CHS3-4]|uniref:TonB C-terminal domain-containing protein n=1 Tax=Marinobacter sp. CHS3-4 TaxID=3045174 RepID=UPI0024B61FEA|nr:TonB C-terminal domain-containing protein [Marinobacter sp. CHS3-4]MDI9244033.1 TonB C-terminal domain-containing protein [Marinobacter sp. CHS3-4]
MRTIALLILLISVLPAFADSPSELCATVGDCRKRIHSTVTDNWKLSEVFSVAGIVKVKVILSTQMTGRIEGIKIMESSGSVLFDETAIDAVEATGPFVALGGLESEDYRESFREFIIQFEADGPSVPDEGLSDEEFLKLLPSYSGNSE